MNIWVFSEHHYGEKPRTYGGFKIVRETPTRYYFEHVIGDTLNCYAGGPGNAFDYHKGYWLAIKVACQRRIGIVSDEEGYDALIESHRAFDERINERREAHDAEMRELKKSYLESTSNIRMENDDADEG